MFGYRGKIGRAVQADGVTHRPSYFIPELDGDTAPDLETIARWRHEEAEAAAEIAAEVGYERHLETNDQYRWEVEQDEQRAAFWSGA